MTCGSLLLVCPWIPKPGPGLLSWTPLVVYSTLCELNRANSGTESKEADSALACPWSGSVDGVFGTHKMHQAEAA